MNRRPPATTGVRCGEGYSGGVSEQLVRAHDLRSGAHSSSSRRAETGPRLRRCLRPHETHGCEALPSGREHCPRSPDRSGHSKCWLSCRSRRDGSHLRQQCRGRTTLRRTARRWGLRRPQERGIGQLLETRLDSSCEMQDKGHFTRVESAANRRGCAPQPRGDAGISADWFSRGRLSLTN